jgi:hypothetical protein
MVATAAPTHEVKAALSLRSDTSILMLSIVSWIAFMSWECSLRIASANLVKLSLRFDRSASIFSSIPMTYSVLVSRIISLSRILSLSMLLPADSSKKQSPLVPEAYFCVASR